MKFLFFITMKEKYIAKMFVRNRNSDHWHCTSSL